ncbi:MAG: hypothetical protein H6613_01390 [Ignavibacteriales bacterium]|nr:hypothetical protein [Ignavibacteriales bacterium]
MFSDIKGNIIYKWTEGKGKEIYLNPSDSTNGLTYDLNGNLIAGQMGKRRIVRFERMEHKPHLQIIMKVRNLIVQMI